MGVTFNNEESMGTRYAASAARKGLAGFVMSLGLAKTERGAQYVLVVVIGLSILVAAYVLISSQPPRASKPLPAPGDVTPVPKDATASI